MSCARWLTADAAPALAANDIHVWRLPLSASPARQHHLARCLSETERARAARYLSKEHGARFLVGRALVRQVLAGYLNQPPERLDFVYGQLGKPGLLREAAQPDLRFNFSNSGDLGLLAVTRACDLGVDLERQRPLHDLLGLAARYFAEAESQYIASLSSREQHWAFLRCWTRKEAFLKAVGKGLTYSLRKVELRVEEGIPPAFQAIDGDPAEAAAWSLVDLAPDPLFHGALAVRRPIDRLLLLQLPGGVEGDAT